MILLKETSVIINYCFHNPFVERSTHPTWKPTIKTIYDWSTIAWSCHIRPQLKSLFKVYNLVVTVRHLIVYASKLLICDHLSNKRNLL